MSNERIRDRAKPRPRVTLGTRVMRRVRDCAISLRIAYLRKFYGMDIGDGCRMSLKANLDRTHPKGIHIGAGTFIAFDAVILTHDMSRLLRFDNYIGKNCFIGARSIILPGVRIGDCCIIGAGSVVSKDVPDGSIAVGNPARVVRSGIKTVQYGILADDHAEAYAEAMKYYTDKQ